MRFKRIFSLVLCSGILVSSSLSLASSDFSNNNEIQLLSSENQEVSRQPRAVISKKVTITKYYSNKNSIPTSTYYSESYLGKLTWRGYIGLTSVRYISPGKYSAVYSGYVYYNS